jgi:hypothetical protein
MALDIQPQTETRPAPAPAPREPQAHLPLRARLKTAPLTRAKQESVKGASTSGVNGALAGLQLLIGYEWLVSGGDKLLFGDFPARLGGLLTPATSGGQVPGFFAALLRALVLPNATLFGYLIEWGETLAGAGLVAAGLVALLRPFVERRLRGRLAVLFAFGVRLLERLSSLAAAGAGVLGLSFFLLDGLPAPWFTPSIAYGGAIDTGLFLAAASAVLVVSQLAQRHQH